MRFAFALVAVVALITACPPSALSPPADAADATTPDASTIFVIDPTSTADPPVDSSSLSSRACANLRRFHCPEAYGVDGGRSCLATFEHEKSGKVFDLKPRCIADAGTLAVLRACGTFDCVGGY